LSLAILKTPFGDGPDAKQLFAFLAPFSGYSDMCSRAEHDILVLKACQFRDAESWL